MFSFVPRCPGARRVAEVDRDTAVDREPRVVGHLLALVPGKPVHDQDRADEEEADGREEAEMYAIVRRLATVLDISFTKEPGERDLQSGRGIQSRPHRRDRRAAIGMHVPLAPSAGVTESKLFAGTKGRRALRALAVQPCCHGRGDRAAICEGCLAPTASMIGTTAEVLPADVGRAHIGRDRVTVGDGRRNPCMASGLSTASRFSRPSRVSRVEPSRVKVGKTGMQAVLVRLLDDVCVGVRNAQETGGRVAKRLSRRGPSRWRDAGYFLRAWPAEFVFRRVHGEPQASTS